MTTLPARELSPIQQVASDAALDWDTYSRQQTNAALNLLDARLSGSVRIAADRSRREVYLPRALASLDHCAEALRSLGVE